jgi:hypothetical protein
MSSSTTYSVTTVRGCKVVAMPIPIIDLVALMRAWDDGQQDDPWIMDGLLSDYFAPSMIFGPRSACDAWRAELDLWPVKRPGEKE